jgi:hypothetical protein
LFPQAEDFLFGGHQFVFQLLMLGSDGPELSRRDAQNVAVLALRAHALGASRGIFRRHLAGLETFVLASKTSTHLHKLIGGKDRG